MKKEVSQIQRHFRAGESKRRTESFFKVHKVGGQHFTLYISPTSWPIETHLLSHLNLQSAVGFVSGLYHLHRCSAEHYHVRSGDKLHLRTQFEVDVTRGNSNRVKV
jgi:hypothetical protein